VKIPFWPFIRHQIYKHKAERKLRREVCNEIDLLVAIYKCRIAGASMTREQCLKVADRLDYVTKNWRHVPFEQGIKLARVLDRYNTKCLQDYQSRNAEGY
jgi:hypothetical protein